VFKEKIQNLEFPLCPVFAVAEESRLQIHLCRSKNRSVGRCMRSGGFSAQSELGKSSSSPCRHGSAEEATPSSPELVVSTHVSTRRMRTDSKPLHAEVSSGTRRMGIFLYQVQCCWSSAFTNVGSGSREY